MNSITRNDGLVEGQAGLGTMPGDEFIDEMLIGALDSGERKAAEDRSLSLI
jgi:hypothetical protein